MKLTNKGKAIEFDTYPNDDIFYCSWFVVPFDWFVRTFRKEFKIENPMEWLENFYYEYTWDDTWLIYNKAVEDNIILEEGNDS